MSSDSSTVTSAAIRAAFESQAPLSIGLEEELMLLDPDTGDLAPLADEVLERVSGDPRFKREMPAAQLEIRTEPAGSVRQVIADLETGRHALTSATAGLVRLATAGTHPFAAAEGELNPGERYEHSAREYGALARRQLVFALQVHIAPGSSSRALGVYNALRAYLPEIAALAANSPFHDGRDTGLASIRPKIAEQLPRQGAPPPIASWDEFAAALAWGAAAGSTPSAAGWWWELRPHPEFGTLELRVPDAQTTVADAAGVAAFAHCLVAELCERHDANDLPPPAPTWRIAENRWWAARDGVEGQIADLITGRRSSTRERLHGLIDELASTAARLGCTRELEISKKLVDENGAIRQRAVVCSRGLDGLVPWLSERWNDESPDFSRSG